MVLLGGRDLGSGEALALVDVYHPDSERWEELPPLPLNRGLVHAVVLHDAASLVVLGDQALELFEDGRWQVLAAAADLDLNGVLWMFPMHY